MSLHNTTRQRELRIFKTAFTKQIEQLIEESATNYMRYQQESMMTPDMIRSMQRMVLLDVSQRMDR